MCAPCISGLTMHFFPETNTCWLDISEITTLGLSSFFLVIIFVYRQQVKKKKKKNQCTILSLCNRPCYNNQVFNMVLNTLRECCALGSTLNTVCVVACPSTLTIIPDYVHGLVDDVRLVNSDDLPRSILGCKHGQDACATAYVQNNLVQISKCQTRY